MRHRNRQPDQAGLTAGLRELAQWLDQHPYTARWVHGEEIVAYVDGDDTEIRAHVAHAANQMGTSFIDNGSGCCEAALTFPGNVSLRIIGLPKVTA